MRPNYGKFTSAAVAAALVFSSTAAAAAPAGKDAWTTLSMMNPAGATALGGAAVAAQDPVVVRDDTHGDFYLPIPVLAVILAVIAVDIWILTKDHHHHAHFVSPA
jgi:hypothetical protein